MSKKSPVVINYGGHRVRLDTIATFLPIYTIQRNESNHYGIRFHLRNGEEIDIKGNDEVSRDKAIAFLDNYFKPVLFTLDKCQVCIHQEERKRGDCYKVFDCAEFKGLRGFKRRGESNAALSSDNGN